MTPAALMRAAALAIALLCASCVLRQPAVVADNYVLDLPLPARGPASARTVAVLPFGHSSVAGGRLFLYRADGLRYETDYYNRFLEPPGQMLTGALRRWLREARAGEVLAPGAPLAADFMVQPRLSELYADYRDVGNPRAVVAMRFVVYALEPGGNRQVLDRGYRREEPLREVSPGAAVEGWSRGVAGIFASFTRDFRAVQ